MSLKINTFIDTKRATSLAALPLSMKAFWRSLLTILFSIILSLITLNAQKRIPYEFKQFNISDGLPDNTVYGCLQDSENYMWFFTPSGASRFNGRTFDNFTINQNLADNEVLNAFEDSQKRIWFYSFNGKLSFFNLKTKKIESYREHFQLKQLSNRTVVKSIVEDGFKKIWICYENHRIAILDKKNIDININIAQITDKLNHNFGSCYLFLDKKNKINLIENKLTAKLNEVSGKFENFNSVDAIKNIYAHHKGEIYYCSNKGIYKWNGVESVFIIDVVKSLGKEVVSLSFDDDNNLWIGTPDGLLSYNLLSQKITTSLYIGVPVSKVFKDKESNYWITTIGKGVLLLSNGFQHVSIKNKFYGLLENEISCLGKNYKNGNILFAARPNLIYTIKNKNSLFYTKIDTTEKLTINKIKCVGDDLWFITQNNNIDIYPDFFTSIPTSIQLKPHILSYKNSIKKSIKLADFEKLISSLKVVKNIYLSKDTTIYISFGAISKIKLKNYKFQNFYGLGIFESNKANALKMNEGRIYAITEDKQGRIWIGGTHGLGSNDLNNDTTFYYYPQINFLSTINDMCALSNNTLVISTTGSGVYVVKNQEIIAHYLEENGLSSNNCNKIFKQDEHNVWVATSKGASLINFEDTTYNKAHFTIYGGKNNNPATYINDILINNDTLYLATNDGLYSFDINKMTPQSNKPILKLLSPTSFIENPDKIYSLKYGFFENENQINFQFESIAFLNGDYITYQYQLYRNGTIVQSDTINQKDKFVLPFSSLTPGSYRLVVSCKRGDNIESDKIISQFEVSSPIWRSLGAIILYILLGGWLFFRVLQRFTQRSREQKEFILKQQSEKVQFERIALEARQRLLELEQDSLRARVDPHFIFNCLNGLMSFVYDKDFESIKKLLPRLARLVRNSLQLGKKDFISIINEKNYLEDYLSLEKMRFEDRFDYEIIIDSDVDELKPIIPPLMLQIFAENAIRHGFKGLPKDKQGFIKIHFQQNMNEVSCVVEDNGIGISQSMKNVENKEHISLGLEIVRKRIAVLNEIHAINYQLDFTVLNDQNLQNTGTRVVLNIPLSQ